MSTIRTFVAVDVAKTAADRAKDLIHQLQPAGSGVKWVEPDNLHLTLKFLGDVPEAEIPAICRRVAEASAEFSSFEVTFRGAGAFPDIRRPRTLWIGVELGGDELRQLQGAIDGALARLGFPKERRRFQPHLTIGRIRRGGPGLQTLSQLLRDNQEYDAGKTTISEVIAYASFLDKAGPTYTALGRTPLITGSEERS